MPFPDASFDKAICTYALNIIPDYVRTIEEVHRVLVPGGRFVYVLSSITDVAVLYLWLAAPR